MTINAFERGLSLTHSIKVIDLPSEGLQYQGPLSEALVTELLGTATHKGSVRFQPRSPGSINIEVHPIEAKSGPGEAPKVRVSGHLKLALTTTCVRCLTAVHPDLEPSIDVLLHPESDPHAGVGVAAQRGANLEDQGLEAWEESFPHPSELGEDAYDGKVIPLFALLQESVLIELPSDPACEDTIACDVRTQALIDEANTEAAASDAKGDPRWEALRALKSQLDPTKSDK